MEHPIPRSHMSETLEHLCRHWEEKRKAAEKVAQLPTTPPLTIALAREAGTQGTAIGREVGARLGWPVYDHELLETIAEQMGLRTRLLKSVDERRMSWMEEMFNTFMEIPYVNEVAYAQHLIKTILALGTHGESVIVGRGAAHILPVETTLRVRLIAPLKERINVWSKELGIRPTDAARQVKVTDEERIAFVKEHFQKDPSDLHRYDLVVDHSRFGVPGCAGLIVAALNGLQAQMAPRIQEPAVSH